MNSCTFDTFLLILSFLVAAYVTLGGEEPPTHVVTLFDAGGGATWRNHVQVVPNPLGDDGKVLVAERVAKDRCQMTFVNENGFLTVPDGYKGAVVLRLLVKGKGRIRVALVAGEKIKSYYRTPPEENKWFEIDLALSELEGKIAPGEKIGDITLWLLPPQEGTILDPEAQLFLDRVTLRTPNPTRAD